MPLTISNHITTVCLHVMRNTSTTRPSLEPRSICRFGSLSSSITGGPRDGLARALRALTRADGAPTQNAEPSGLAYTARRVPTDASHVDEGIIPSTFAEEQDAGQAGRARRVLPRSTSLWQGCLAPIPTKMDSQISPTGLHAGQAMDAGEVKDTRVAWLAVLTTTVVTLIAAAFLLIRPLGGPPRLRVRTPRRRRLLWLASSGANASWRKTAICVPPQAGSKAKDRRLRASESPLEGRASRCCRSIHLGRTV